MWRLQKVQAKVQSAWNTCGRLHEKRTHKHMQARWSKAVLTRMDWYNRGQNNGHPQGWIQESMEKYCMLEFWLNIDDFCWFVTIWQLDALGWSKRCQRSGCDQNGVRNDASVLAALAGRAGWLATLTGWHRIPMDLHLWKEIDPYTPGSIDRGVRYAYV